jgi:bifunctional DNA-binding transcriptional regulator/antitoxin component of YhaV-PrlF toxin-antitoxin module
MEVLYTSRCKYILFSKIHEIRMFIYLENTYILGMVMKRKIVQHGNTSLTISLPIQWAKRFDLKKGDELDIEEREKSLLISTEKAIKTERVVLDVSEFDERSLVWHLVSLHKSGFDEIKLIFKDHHQMSIIQKKMSSSTWI